MEILDPAFAGELLSSISPFAVTLGVLFATAEFIFQWFIRIAFAKSNKSVY